MLILGLGYITVKSDKLEDWTEFSRDYLGMQLVDKTKSTAVLRMDERKQRFVVTNETNSSNIFGWEVADKKDLALLASRLEKAEIVVTKEPKSLAEQRFVSEVISFSDPSGNRHEAFHGAVWPGAGMALDQADGCAGVHRRVGGFDCRAK